MASVYVDDRWGIRSLITGRVYSWGTTKRHAELMWAVTGTPERYEVVQQQGPAWVADTSASFTPVRRKAATAVELRRRAERRRKERACYGMRKRH